MSYVRWGADGSDVYIYDDVYVGLYCCACELEGATCGTDFDAMLTHIALHRQMGDHVPEWVDQELKNERNGKGWRAEYVKG